MTAVWILRIASSAHQEPSTDARRGELKDVFDSDVAAMAHAEALMKAEGSTVAPQWATCGDQLVWSIVDLQGGWRTYLVSAHEVKKGRPGGVEVVTPPPTGDWAFDWTCKTDGCGATLRARADDISVHVYEERPNEFVASCPFCGSETRVPNTPPRVRQVAFQNHERGRQALGQTGS